MNTRTSPHQSARDARKHYLICGTKFSINPKYRLIKAIGHGAYGVVCSAQNTETGEYVAIKKISNIFNNSIETKRAIREVRLLRKLRHENIISILDLSTDEGFTDLYLTSELMESDLHQIIISKQPLTNDHVQYFIYQILRGLLFIHSADVIHRDLKPSNILVNSNCDVKICDFGLARAVNFTEDHQMFMTEYVATRWYRAPEIMLSWKHYQNAIDVWAVGCILAELLARKPLFPGSDYMDQLKRIFGVIGKPSLEDINQVQSERARSWLRSLPPTAKISWASLLPNADVDALDLLNEMLTFNPDKRITVEACLRHPFFTALHDAEDEPRADFTFDFSFEKEFEPTANNAVIRKVLIQEFRWFEEFQKQRLTYFMEQKLKALSVEDNMPITEGSLVGPDSAGRTEKDVEMQA